MSLCVLGNILSHAAEDIQFGEQISSHNKYAHTTRHSTQGWSVQVPCHFVPQLQMEMLASGANSALVVCRSATKLGIHESPLPLTLDM